MFIHYVYIYQNNVENETHISNKANNLNVLRPNLNIKKVIMYFRGYQSQILL